MKFRSGYALVGSLEYVNNPGNGSAVPVYYLDEKLKVIKPKLAKDGSQITKSLYDEIQMFVDMNDYKRIIKQNGGSLNGLDFGPKNDSHVDLTQFASASELLNAQSRLANAGVSHKSILEKLKDLLTRKNNDVNISNENVKSEVKENEIKK